MTRRIFALVGDTHADADNRFDEHNEVMAWIPRDAAARGAQALLHSGDVYERTSNSREREAVIDWVLDAARLMPVFIVAGNHDDPLDIRALNLLRTVHPVRAFISPATLLLEAKDSPLATVAALPWPRKAHLLAGAAVTSQRAGSEAAALALRNILRDLGARFAGVDECLPRIFLGHVMVRGSRVGVSQPPLVGADFELGVEDLAVVGADAYCLGHIHLGQDWRVHAGAMAVPTVQQIGPFVEEGAPLIYPGSPSRKNFGELDDKGYVLLTFEDRQLLTWERIPTPCRKMLHLTGSVGTFDGGPLMQLDDVPEVVENAELRVRYETKAEDRVASRLAAESMQRRLMERGAANVVIEEVVKVEQRARAPEVAAATTNADRLRAHWKSKAMEFDRQQEVILKLIALEVLLADSSTTARLGALRFRSVHVDGFGPLKDRLVVFTELEGKLTAVTGTNGAGKSTLLELLLGAVYRRLPTRGSLVDLAVTRDAFVEVVVETGGHTYLVRQLVDMATRRSEALITCDGEPAVHSSKVSAVEDYVDHHFPSLDLQLVSTFAAQQSRGFLDTKPAERKKLLLQVRGVEQLQALAALARANAQTLTEEIGQLAARIDERTADAASLDTLRDDHGRECVLHSDSEAKLQQAERRLESAILHNVGARLRQGSIEQHREKAFRLNQHLTVARGEQKSLAARMTRQLALVDRADEIRAASARWDAIAAERGELSQAEALDEAEASTAKQRCRQLEQALGAAQDRRRVATNGWAAKGAVEDAIRRRPAVAETLTHATATFERVRGELRALESQHLEDADERITRLREGLLAIFMDESNAGACAEATLKADDATVAKAAELPTDIANKSGQLGAAERAMREAEQALRKTEITAAGEDLVKRASEDFATAEADCNRLSAEIADQVALSSTILTRRSNRQSVRNGLIAEAEKLRSVAIEVTALVSAEAALAELRPQVDRGLANISALELEMAELGPAPEAVAMADEATPKAECEHLRTILRTATARIERLSQRIEQCEAAAAAIAKHTAEKAAKLLELSDWQRLTLDLGKDGLQAALSDAALPELVALTNTLLHSAFGPRFTVDVRSQAADAKGKRMLETLDVVVIDTLHGREALAETYSGGELTIIGEALSLALTVLACRSSDGTPPTLVRDEAGAALDPENARAWVNMLRRAVEMTGADRLLFVSHSPEVTALADSRIEL